MRVAPADDLQLDFQPLAQPVGLCPAYPAPTRARRMRVHQQDRFHTIGLAAPRSRTQAAAITTADTSPIASTAMRRTWRERAGPAVVLAAAGYSGTTSGRSPEGAVRGSRRAAGPAPKDTAKAAARNNETPVEPGVYGESSWPLFPFRLLPPVLAVHDPGPPVWRAEGEPSKPAQRLPQA